MPRKDRAVTPRRTKTVEPVDVAAQLAAHEAAIAKLRLDLTPPTYAQRHPLPGKPIPSPFTTQLAARQERARRHRVEEQRLRAEAEAEARDADAPRRAKIEAELAESEKKIATARAEVNRLEHEHGKIRRSL
jgi:hypothetical protein